MNRAENNASDDGGFSAYFGAANAANLPSFQNGPLFCAFLDAANEKLTNLQAAVEGDGAMRLPAFLLDKVRSLRSTLSNLLVHFAEKLGPQSGDATRVGGGWTRMTGAFAVALRCTSLLLSCRESGVAENLKAYDAAQSRYLTRNGLVCFPGPGATASLSMKQLEFVVGDVLRSRLDLLDSLHPDLHVYVSALEARCAALAFPTGVLPVSVQDYDNLAWTQDAEHFIASSGPENDALPGVSSTFLNVSAWWFVWVRRYVNSYVRVTEHSFWPKIPMLRGQVFPGDAAPKGILAPAAAPARTGDAYFTVPWDNGVPHALVFFSDFSRTLHTDEHMRAWKTKTGSKFEVLPGDFELFACRGGAAANEQPTVRGVFDAMRTTAQARYSAFGRYKKPLHAWLHGAVARCTLTGGKLPGAPPGHLYEQLAFLHCVNSFFVSRKKVPWFHHYVVFQRHGHMKLAVSVQKAARNGVPFLVQRFGRWACCVPAHESMMRPAGGAATGWVALETGMTLRLGDRGGAGAVLATQRRRAAHGSLGEGRAQEICETDGVQVYEAANAYAAVNVWCAAILEGPWQGTLHGKVQCREVFENVFSAPPMPR